MCILTINIVIHPALRNNMGDTKRAKISNSNKNFRTFKCKILISIIWLFQFVSFLAVVDSVYASFLFIYVCFCCFCSFAFGHTSNSLWNINVFRIFKLPTSRYVKKKIHLNSTYLIHDNKTTWNKQKQTSQTKH